MDAVSTDPTTRRWHRRVAWVALVAVLCFATTGLLHPLMTRLQPQPAQRTPPPMPVLDHALPAPALALAAVGVGELKSLRLLHDGERWRWRAETEGDVRWLDAETGEPMPDQAERAQAVRLARWYAGEPNATVAAIERVETFDADYGYVNRLLPVWRVRFDRADALAVYVSTGDDRLATMSDARKRAFQSLFRAVHSWSWLPAPWRNGWINALLIGVLATTALGLARAVRTRGGRRWTLRRAHRWGGVALALAVVAWSTSGFVQARGNAARERADSPQRPLHVDRARLTAAIAPSGMATAGASLVSLAGEPVWSWALTPPRTTTGQGLAMGEHQHLGATPQAVEPPRSRYVSAVDGRDLPDAAAQHLAELATYFGIVAVGAPQRVDAFTHEYGFLFKRLPVFKLMQDDAAHTAWYLDPASERLAARIYDGDRIAGAFFAYAHKWEWLTPLAGKDWRDGLSAFVALGVVLLAIGGTLLRRRAVR